MVTYGKCKCSLTPYYTAPMVVSEYVFVYRIVVIGKHIPTGVSACICILYLVCICKHTCIQFLPITECILPLIGSKFKTECFFTAVVGSIVGRQH